MENYTKLKNQQIVEGQEPLTAMYNTHGQRIEFFEHPRLGDDFPVIGKIHGVVFNTGFYDLDDFYTDSEYQPVLVNDEVIQQGEVSYYLV